MKYPSITAIANSYRRSDGSTTQGERNAYLLHDMRAVRWQPVSGDDIDLALARMCYYRFYDRDKKGIRALWQRTTEEAYLAVKHSPYWLIHRDEPLSGDLMFSRYKFAASERVHVSIVDTPINNSELIWIYETPPFYSPSSPNKTIVDRTRVLPERMRYRAFMFYARLLDEQEVGVVYRRR
jgi:hypothetical protein